MKLPIPFLLSFFLLTAIAAAQTICGTVADSEGKPVAGATVAVVYPKDYVDTSHQTRSAVDGTFELDLSFLNTDEKKWKIDYSLVATKGETLGTWKRDTLKNPETEKIEIRLDPTVCFHGTVADKNGQPVAEARVAILYSNQHEVLSDREGHYEILVQNNENNKKMLANGNIGVRVFKEGYALEIQSLWATERSIFTRLSETRKKAVFRAVDVEGKPLPDVLFTLTSVTAFNLQKVSLANIVRKTDSDGRVVFDCIPDWANGNSSCLVHADTGNSPVKRPQFNPSTDSDREIEVEMFAPVKLGGTIRKEDGTPLADTWISIVNHYVSDRVNFSDITKTDSQGQYEFFVTPDLVYESPKIIESDPLECQIFGGGRIIYPDRPVVDWDFVAKKTYKVCGQILLPSDFEETKISQYRTLLGTVVFHIFFFEGDETSLISSPQNAIDSKEHEFQYSKSSIIKRLLLEYEKGKPTKYEIRLPKGRFAAGFGVERKVFDVSGDEPEVVVDLKLKN